MPVATKNAQKGAPKLLIGESVTERVQRRVEVAQPIGDVVDDVRYAAERRGNIRTEADQQRQHVPWRPADYKRAEDNSDGTQRLPSTILLLTATSTRYRSSFVRAPLNTEHI